MLLLSALCFSCFPLVHMDVRLHRYRPGGDVEGLAGFAPLSIKVVRGHGVVWEPIHMGNHGAPRMNVLCLFRSGNQGVFPWSAANESRGRERAGGVSSLLLAGGAA